VSSAIACAGRSGDGDIKPTPAPATTDDKPTDHEGRNSEDPMPVMALAGDPAACRNGMVESQCAIK
jgi:hypothetical protein